MTYFRTRRTLGSITYGGEIAGPAYLGAEVDEGDIVPNGRAVRGFCFSAGMSIVNVFGSQSSDDGSYNITPSASATRPNGYQWYVGVDPHGTDVTWDAGLTTSTTILPDAPVDLGYNLAFTGSWSIVVECVEVFTVEGADFPNHPNFGGPHSDDWPPQGDVSIYLLAVAGSRITASVSCGGISALVGGTVATDFVVPASIGLNIQAFARGTSNHPGQTSAASLSGKITVNGLDEPISGSVSHSGALYAGSASGGTVSATVSTNLANIGPSSELCNGGGDPTRRANLAVVVRGPSGAYPAAIGARIYGTPGSPGYTDADVPATLSIVQERHSFTVAYWAFFDPSGGSPVTATTSASKDEYAAVYLVLRKGTMGDGDTKSLYALGEDQRLWRCLQRGFYRDGMSLSQSDSVPFDSTTVSASGPTGTITRTFSNYSGSYAGKSANGYRIMRLALTADAASQPATIHIGSKTWSVTVGTSGTIDIDLLCPNNATATADATDTQWPLPSEWGPLSGVQHVTSVVINGLADGHTYTLTGITLRRNSTRTLTALPEFQNWLQEAAPAIVGDVTTTNFLRRYLLADTDAKQSLEIPDASKLVSSAGGGTTTYGSALVGSFITNLNAAVSYPNDGWTGTDLCAPPGGCSGDVQALNCYLNDTLFLMCAGGGGATIDNSNTWTYWQAVNAVGTVTLPLQMLYDRVITWYGGCGDVFGFGGGSTALEMRAAGFLRGLSWGNAAYQDMTPASGVTVDLELTSDHSAAGGATTDVQGRFATGTPYGLGLKTYDTIAEVGVIPYPALTRPFFSRKWHRVSLRPRTPGHDLFLLRDYTHRLMIFYGAEDGSLRVDLYNDVDAAPMTVIIDDATDCSKPSFYRSGVYIEGTYLRGTTPYSARTRTHGRTWTMDTVDGTYDAITSTLHKGRIIFLGYKNATPKWFVRVGVSDDSGTFTWSDEVDLELTNPNGQGHVRTRSDGVIEFVWQDNTNATMILRGRAVGNDGGVAGDWT